MKNLKRMLVVLILVIIFINTSLPLLAVFYEPEDTEEEKSNYYEIENNDDLEYENYSDDYKAYLKLSDEEKSKVEVIPPKYNVSLEEFFKKNLNDSNKNINSYKNIKKEIIAKGANSEIDIIADYNQDEIPEAFDLRDKIDIKVEKQGTYGLCWAFSSLTSLETYLSLNMYGNFDYSELHLDYLESNEFKGERTLHGGGNFFNFIDYAINYGPVYEKEVPYPITETGNFYGSTYTIDDYDYFSELEKKAYVTDIIEYPWITKKYDSKNNIQYYNFDTRLSNKEINIVRNMIKKQIMENGSVMCTIVSPDEKNNYNKVTNSEFFKGTLDTFVNPGNEFHAVSIIGWDDNYPKENFLESNRPTTDGAYLAVNSWGDNWGEHGTFYISYEDSYIEQYMYGIESASTEIDNKNLEKIIYKDENLYNALKDTLKNGILDYDDENLAIYYNPLFIDSVEEIDLSNKNISNIYGLDVFTKLKNINLSNNNINDLTIISNLYSENISIDVSGNPVDLGTLDIDNVAYLKLNDCNIEDLNFIYSDNYNSKLALELKNNDIKDLKNLPNKIDSLDLSGNKHLNLNELNNKEIKNLYLNNCDIDNNKMQELSSNVYKLDLSYNPISSLDFLNKFQGLYGLNVSYTNISDVSDISTTQIRELDISGINNMDGISLLNNIYELCMNNCGIEDLSIFSRLQNLMYLHLDNNNITDISNIKSSLYGLSLNNNNIDIETIPNLKKLIYLYLENCNISDISFLNRITNQNSINVYLDNNNVNSIKNLYDEKVIVHLKNQKVENEIDLQVGKENCLDFPELLEYSVNQRFKEDILLECENCEVDLKSKKIIIKSDDLGNGTASVKVNGGKYDGLTYYYNYNMMEGIEIETVDIEYLGKTVYCEGEDFDDTKLNVYVKYVNGIIENTKDYELIDNKNLQEGQTRVSIKFNDFSENIAIRVVNKDDIKKIKFNDIALYKSVYKNLINKYTIIDKNDEKFEIDLLKEDIDKVESLNLEPTITEGIDEIKNLTGLSEFKNLSYINLTGYNSNDFFEIKQLYNLEKLDIRGSSVENVSMLYNHPKLKLLTLVKTNIRDLGDLSDTNLQFSIEEKSELEEENVKNNILYLPEYFSEVLELCNNPKITVTYVNNKTYQTIKEEKSIEIDSDGKIFINLYNKEFYSKNISQVCIKVVMQDENTDNEIYYNVEYNVTKNIENIQELKFNDKNLYLAIAQQIDKDSIIELDNNNYIIKVRKDYLDEVQSIMVETREIEDLTGISEFKNLKELSLGNYVNDDLNEILKLEKLEKLTIKNSPINNISSLNKLEYLNYLELDNTSVYSIGNLNGKEITYNIKGYSVGETLERKDKKLYLPEYFTQIYKINPNVEAKVLINEEINNIEVDETGRLYFIFDIELPHDEMFIEAQLDDKENGTHIFERISFDKVDRINYNFGYEVNDKNMLIDVKSKTPINSFIQELKNDYDVEVIINDGQELNTKYAATGMKIEIKNKNGDAILDENGNPIIFTLIVKGDVNGDGIANANDHVLIKAYRMEIYGAELKEENFEAADLNGDGKIDYKDSNLLLLHRSEVQGYSLDF